MKYQSNLQFIADALLALCAEDDRPAYTENELERRGRHRMDHDISWTLAALDSARDVLSQRECIAIVERAKLTDRQDRILRHRIAGRSFEHISRLFGTSKQNVQVAFVAALKKIRRACRVYPYSGLSEVYRWEVRRGAS
jgi:DNA-directed RNA polymerase sigma subunit (sigma70/sigma32)